MPLPTLFLLVAAAQVDSRPITVTGHGGIPFISPMGEPFRARSVGEDTLARWFYQADRNHDGFLTPDEMQADAERYFPEIDADHDGQIDPDEVVRYEWQVAPEIQVNSRLRRARTPAEQAAFEAESKAEENRPAEGNERLKGKRAKRDPMDHGPQGAGRYALFNMPEPVAAADGDFNRSITLAEFRAAALARFQVLDTKHQGRLSLADLEAMKPVVEAGGKKGKRPKEEPDTRVGIPLPPEPSVPSN